MSNRQLINLTALARSFQDAAVEDGRALAFDRLIELLEEVAQATSIPDPIEIDAAGEIFGALTLIFPIHLLWIPKLGRELGVQVEQNNAGTWVLAGMPALNAQVVVLRQVAVAAIGTLDDDSEARFGYRVTDVVNRIAETGEDQHQANARVHAEKVGLRSAGAPKESPRSTKTEPSSRDASSVASPTGIDLTSACVVLEGDFSADGKALDGSRLLSLFLTEVERLGVGHLVTTLPNTHIVCDISLLYLTHAGWIASIAGELGLPTPGLGEQLEGLNTSSKRLADLRDLGLARVAVMERERAAKTGFSILEPVIESARTGEPLEQAAARVHHRHTGLRPVK